ncbi:hypothetical protein G9A89_017347 [Geosiphon pyriformis]|nr:hypothetical protein G9A89_017347 [Geosiphon pyriformis]
MNNPTKQENIVYWHKNMGNLISIITETKLKDKVHLWLVNKFDSVYVFTSGMDLGYLDSGVAIIMNISLAHYVYKVFENKHSVSILGLYVGASLVTFNESSFIILGGNFNENGSHKYVSYQKCLDLGLVNSLVGSLAVKKPTWKNSRGIVKMINYMFVSLNLVNVIVHCDVSDVSKHFDTDHQTVFVSVDLGVISANTTMLSVKFAATSKDFGNVFTKNFLRFYKLKLLVSKIVRALCEKSVVSFLDNVKSSIIQNLVNTDVSFDCVHFALYDIKKFYHAFKLVEFLKVNETNIKSAIDKKMESFVMNKSYTIKSVLEYFFCKVVLNYLVVNNKLIMEPDVVKFKVDVIIKDWTRKHSVVADISDVWSYQYQLLEYIFDEAFSGVMCSIEFDELFGVISDLFDGKAAGLLDISNKL